MKGTRRGVLDVVVNLSVLAFVGYAAFGPDGFVRGRWLRHQEALEVRAFLTENWEAIVGSTPPERPILVEFVDYQCPFCREMYAVLSRGERDGRFEVLRRHLPLDPIHPQARIAARSAICAERWQKGDDMHAQLITMLDWGQGDDGITRTAERVGIPELEKFRACLEDPETDARLQADADLARRLGVRSTPTFVGRGGLHRGVATLEDLADLASSGR